MLLDVGGFAPEIYSIEELAAFTRKLVGLNLGIFAESGLVDLREYPVIYKPEPNGINYFQDVEDILSSGIADCEDLASWLVAWYLFQGVPAYPVFEKQSPTLFHVVVKARIGSNRKFLRLDPSRWFGMGQ